MPTFFFAGYSGLLGKHCKPVRITWPVWFYAAVTGVIVYWVKRPYDTTG
ncbi:MAG: DUF420 domain-containing protein [Bacteroidetes bacterium]|nr:DUF420 domain-containing protein [Bacteroidota bacterium]